MAKAALVEKDIQAGKDLVKKLDEAEMGVTAAYWIYNSDSEYWKLMVATDYYDNHSNKDTYLKILSVLDKFGQSFPISLMDIHSMSPSDAFVQKMSKAIRVDGISDVRFSRNIIDGEYIEDALIYRSGSL